jgi:hypothetical protein
MDGCHCVSAGLFGFTRLPESGEPGSPEPRLHQIGYHWSMVRQFWLGGHFGVTNEVFAAEALAPILTTFRSATSVLYNPRHSPD